MNMALPSTAEAMLPKSQPDRTTIGFGICATVAVVWAYWPVLQTFWQRWDSDPQYSHGSLVPLMALGLIWLRGVPVADRDVRPSWLGLPLLLAGLGMRHWGSGLYFEWIEWISFLPTLAGACLMVTGVPMFRHLWPSIAFLVFMIPLPYRAELLILQPLQGLATICSTFVLQTLGFAARSEGHVVWIGETAVGVTQACSGLRMLTGFLALSVGTVLVIERDWLKKATLLFSTVPIALLCNITRVTTTGIAYALTGSQEWQKQCHDWLGFSMPLLAMGLLWVELQTLDALLIDEATDLDSGTTSADQANLCAT